MGAGGLGPGGEGVMAQRIMQTMLFWLQLMTQSGRSGPLAMHPNAQFITVVMHPIMQLNSPSSWAADADAAARFTAAEICSSAASTAWSSTPVYVTGRFFPGPWISAVSIGGRTAAARSATPDRATRARRKKDLLVLAMLPGAGGSLRPG